MKKLLLLFFALLTGVSGVWAETRTYTVTYAKGTTYGQYFRSNGDVDDSHWDVKWVSGGNSSTQLPQVTITSNGTSISGYNGYFLNGNYTITVPDGLVITGYTMRAKSHEEGGVTNSEKNIVPDGQSAVALNLLSDSEVTVTGLTSNTATFAITGTENTNSRVIFSSFTINVQANVLGALSEADSQKAYYLVSRRGFLATASGNLGCTVKNTAYEPTALRIVQEGDAYYLKTISGKYVTSTGALANTASEALEAVSSGVEGFPLVLKVGEKYINSGTGGPYGIVWNTYGAEGSSEYDTGNCYAIMEAPADEVLNYSISDVNGQTYTGTFRGVYGITAPDFDGCVGYTLTNASWDADSRTYSATINFPFAVSSMGAEKKVYISSFNSSYQSWPIYWYADGTSVKSTGNLYPTTGDYSKFEWEIIPSIADLKISFLLKNVATGKYIYSAVTTKPSSEDITGSTVSLQDEGTGFSYETNGQWKLPTSADLYLSRHNSNAEVKYIAVWTTHKGTHTTIVDADDFPTLVSNFQEAIKAYTTFKSTHTIGTGLGEYSGATYDDMEAAVAAAQNASSVFTAAQLASYTTTLENPATKLTINIPGVGFYRIKGYSGNYITSTKEGNNAAMNGTASADNIIYYSSDKNLIFYGSGLGIYATHTVAPVVSTLNAFTFSQGAQVGKYNVKSDASGVGQYCYDNSTKLDRYGSAVTSGSYQTDWTVEPVTALPVTITSAKYATLYSPVALEVPTGVTAYTATDNGAYVTLTAIEGTPAIIPAEKGVILYSETAKDYEFAITIGGTAESALMGTVRKITRTATDGLYDSYVLGMDDSNNVGFFRDGPTELAGFKAYLPATSGGSVKAIHFDEETAVKAIEAAQNPGKAVYDLNGRRVENPTKGLYIVNGMKYLVK